VAAGKRRGYGLTVAVRKRAAAASRPRVGRKPERPAAKQKVAFGLCPPDTGTAILAVALDLFAERNFSAVTIKEIAARLGMNTALIYYYFESKEDLFQRSVTMAVDQAFAQFELRRLSLTSPEDVILQWLETHIAAYPSIRKLIKIAMDYATVAKRSPEIDRSIRRFYDGEQALLHASLTEGIAEGAFRALDVAQTALFISTYLDGVIVRSIIMPDYKHEDAIREMQLFLRALLRTERVSNKRHEDPGIGL
jgi:AcrR family transcriptional regulator